MDNCVQVFKSITEDNGERISLKVLFFCAARVAAGAGEIVITTAFPASVNTVKEAVFSKYERLSPFAKSLMIAVNREYASDETAVIDHDEIAFLPPVSGG